MNKWANSKFGILLFIFLIILPVAVFMAQQQTNTRQHAATTSFNVAAIDTMKESKDTLNNPLNDADIADDVNLSATLHVNYITISTPYDAPDYMQRWVNAIRAAGKHVWFRSHFNQWENDYGVGGIMTPGTYLTNLDTFIRQHPTLFKAGDIFDPCPELENGKYWSTTYGGGWITNGTAMNAYNKFILDLTSTADNALHANNIQGVDTHFHSTNGWIAEHASMLYSSTTAVMGRVTTDSYLGQGGTISPADAAQALKTELDAIYNAQKVPVVIGETGYSTQALVNDSQQNQIVEAQFNMLLTLPYLQGVNYWVGAGSPTYDGTRIFTGSRGNWSLRPAAQKLASFYAAKISGTALIATPTAPPFPTPTSTHLSSISDWPTYLYDSTRSSANNTETILSTANAGSLTKLWTFKTGGVIAASPTVAGNTVYVGSWDGYEYAVDTTTGIQKWKTNVGQSYYPNCGSFQQHLGVNSASTIDNGVVYVAGGDSNFYALNAGTGAVLWKVFIGDPAHGYYNFSSPLLYNGNIYYGTASNCDNPLVQGQLFKISLATHAITNTFNVVPAGQLGGAIWTSPSVDSTTNTIYLTTGNGGGYSFSIVGLDASTFAVKGSWKVPSSQQVEDSDFGTTPTLFTTSSGTHMVTANNKNGYIYALNANNLQAGSVWQRQIAVGGGCPECGQGSISSSAFANNKLYAAGGNTTVNGTSYKGAVRAFDPATGNILWEHGTAGSVFAALAYANNLIVDGAGSTLEVLNANNGNVLYHLQTGGNIFSAPSIASGKIFAGSADTNIYAFGLPAGTSPTPPATSVPTVSTQPGDALFNLTICPHGLWNCGDNANPNSIGNAHPLHLQRSVAVTVLDSNNTPVTTKQGNVSGNNSSGTFTGIIDMGNLANGNYLVTIHMDGYLEKQIFGILTLTHGQQASLPAISLITGDINNDKQLDIQDYNIFISCFGSKMNTASCIKPPNVQSSGADINDDGVVDGVDYNLFLRELSVQRSGGSNPTAAITPTTGQVPTTPITSAFARVCGTQICLNGKPYRIHGATAYGTYDNPAGEMTLAKQGNINTLELVEYENNFHSLSDTMSSATWTRVDRFIAEAGKNGIHIILNLSGYGQSLQTAGQNPTGDWQPYLSFVANRVNTVTGIKYANDPTILKIEFWGEIDGPAAGGHAGTTGNTAAITAFFKRSAAEWRALDPNHIVSSGGFSYLDLPNSAGIDWKSIMADPNNQVCDIEVNSKGDRNITVPMVTQYCQSLNKPWFLAAWSSCYQTGGGDLTNEPDIPHMTAHAQDMYAVEKGAAPAAMPAIGSDFWNLANGSSNPGTCNLGPQFPTVWNVIQNN